jgi:DNA repair protein RAD57
MQLSLCVQLPKRLGGISGSACFLSTSWTLPTNRVLEMVGAHPLFTHTLCGLADIHTLKTPTIPILRHVLATTLPAFLDEVRARHAAKPVKLVILDALAELFHSDTKVSSATLTERSRNLAEISMLLHTIASRHRIAVVVINEVIDVIDREPPLDAPPHEVSYRDQVKLFGRADSIPGEDAKEAALGLVWANQVNARIMLSRTRRMRYLDDDEQPHNKRPRLGADTDVGSLKVVGAGSSGHQPIRVRRLTVIFNSVAQPGSLDYIITASGISALTDSEGSDNEFLERASSSRKVPPSPTAIVPTTVLDTPAALSVVNFDAAGIVAGEANVSSEVIDAAENGPMAEEEDEWDAYWKEEDKLGSDVYSQIDFDALSSSLFSSSQHDQPV